MSSDPIVISFKLHGIERTIAALEWLDKKVRRKVVSKAMRAGAKVIQQRAKANAPKGETGNLKRAITVRASKYIGRRKKNRNEVSFNAQIGAGNFKGKTFYGAFQEFGHHVGKRSTALRDYKRATGEDPRRFIEGKHFIERAGKQGEGEAVSVIISTLRQGIEEAAK